MNDSLAEFARAVRESSLKRLRQVPVGHENWRVDAEAMSFADVAQHLIDSDNWLFKALQVRGLEPMFGRAHLLDVGSRTEYDAALERLWSIGEERSGLIQQLKENDLNSLIPDPRFGGDVTVWWVIVRGNLDHEIHHRGQVQAYLRTLRSQSFRSSI